MAIGADGFNTGVLSFRNFVQNGSTQQLAPTCAAVASSLILGQADTTPGQLKRDPVFVAPAQLDLRLQPADPTNRESLFDKAVQVNPAADKNVDHDFYGTPRPQGAGYDIGAFELAQTRAARHVTSATKSNGVFIAMPYWDERFKAMAERYPDIRTDQFHIDILCAHFVQHPDWFDVVVCSNLFGDILSDLGPACTGTIGIAPSANLNPERAYPSMFEPVHGSAPDIAGQGVANPIAQIWSGAMMLEHLGHKDAADAVLRAIETVLAEGPRTRDIGGRAGTQEVGKAIAEAV